ncbi:type VII secretion integral membrane protein EccD [Mycobacteroides abscessus]|uniref:type VII secretion integral membrane protein EccD n=1 Tax=Mycobacteroides abscessus TaxID=36809 RepID=UPI0009264B1B|nr:type VII secretion integral membrane protein EccD [Mycobacteroides abscessus]SHQ49345.1 type VII secretion integral membrane protein EccD [Mycobacteroides abscessus subsp. abscessus]SKQ84481.1 type VII secretion integral membrane protein EccD [Mycobacteroides abscessus subsp. massiliense]SLC49412.1 type VII secretion integral membrane protein EccD [Mycobacteroides abscessus subsp. massiliense]
MAPQDKPSAEKKDKVLVSVVADDTVVDVSLPVNLAVKRLAYSLANYCVNVKGYAMPFLSQANGELMLTPEIGKPFPPEATLAELKIYDGETLVLTSTDRNEYYPEFTSSPASAVSTTQEKFFKRWTAESAQRFYSVAAPLLAGCAALVALVGVFYRSMDYLRWPLVGAAGAMLALSVFIMIAVKQLSRGSNGAVLLSYSITSYVCAFTVGTAIVPGSPGRWHIASGAVCLILAALLLAGVVREPLWLHYGVGTPALVVTIVILVNLMWAENGNTVASEIMLLAAIAVYHCDKTAMAGAKIPLPAMPAPGERLRLVRAQDLVEMAKSASSGKSLTSEINQEARVIIMHNLMGAVGGGAALLVAISALSATLLADEAHMWMQLAFVANVTALLYLFGTWAVDQGLRAILMAAGVLSWFAVLVGLLFSPNTTPVMIGAALAVTALLMFVFGARTWRQPPQMSETMLRKLFLAELALYIPPIVALYFLVDGYTRLRQLHIGL